MSDDLLGPSAIARAFGVSVGAVMQWREKGWLRQESEDPPRVTLAAASEARLTARLSPRQSPLDLDHEIQRFSGIYAIHLADPNVRAMFPGASEADVRGYRQCAAALLDIAELGDLT